LSQETAELNEAIRYQREIGAPVSIGGMYPVSIGGANKSQLMTGTAIRPAFHSKCTIAASHPNGAGVKRLVPVAAEE
jgi:hypothetical protein